jgi:hypothetical protein
MANEQYTQPRHTVHVREQNIEIRFICEIICHCKQDCRKMLVNQTKTFRKCIPLNITSPPPSDSFALGIGCAARFRDALYKVF